MNEGYLYRWFVTYEDDHNRIHTATVYASTRDEALQLFAKNFPGLPVTSIELR